uniref:Uncharacterized protein n=1 Tax=Ditylenchus dipsaci TaxID=166011 RepID=A0A915DIT4_9BILA
MTEGCTSITTHHPTDHKHFRTPWAGTLGMVQQSRRVAFIGESNGFHAQESRANRGSTKDQQARKTNDWETNEHTNDSTTTRSKSSNAENSSSTRFTFLL